LAPLVVAPAAVADSVREKQWHLGFLRVAEAHKLSTGNGVTVAVVDTGVKADHPDLVGNVLPGVDLTGAGTTGQLDTSGHGTAMAGLIAAHGHGANGDDGALGIAPKAKILPVRISATDVGIPDKAVAGINAAVRAGAKVVSISLGTGPFGELEKAITDALAADVVVVASTGNRPNDSFLQYPAGYPGVVAVGATDKAGNIAPVTVTGEQMTLAAPGVEIVSADGVGGYNIGTGTSPATAIVAGAAALVRSRYPDLPAKEVVHRLTATATDKGAPGRDAQYGFGVLNLVAALTADVKPETATASPSAGAGQPAPPRPTQDSGAEPLKLNAAFYLVATLCGVLSVLGIAGLVLWLVLRYLRKSSAKQGPPPGYGAAGQG
jgi:type VII secretion-associated serine protease mycosin